MHLRTYLLFLMLLVLIGLCTVHEAVSQTRARYRLGRLLAQEEERQEEIARLRSELARLKSPARLERANAALGLSREPLATLPPVGGAAVAWDDDER